MPNLPTPDVRKAGEQAATVARTPLLAALGAGDLAAKAVVEALAKARARVNERTEAAKSAVDELPSDLTGLRAKLDPTELRKLVDAYTQSALQLYHYLAEHGEETLDKLRTQPQVKRAVEQVEAAQHRAGDLAGEARDLADDVLGKVTRRVRATGEEAATRAEDVAEDVALRVEDAGVQTAADIRTATRKTAAKTEPGKTEAGKNEPGRTAPRKTSPATRTTTRRTTSTDK